MLKELVNGAVKSCSALAVEAPNEKSLVSKRGQPGMLLFLSLGIFGPKSLRYIYHLMSLESLALLPQVEPEARVFAVVHEPFPSFLFSYSSMQFTCSFSGFNLFRSQNFRSIGLGLAGMVDLLSVQWFHGVADDGYIHWPTVLREDCWEAFCELLHLLDDIFDRCYARVWVYSLVRLTCVLILYVNFEENRLISFLSLMFQFRV